MSKNISVDILNTDSIDNALQQIDKFKEEILKMTTETVKDTALESAKLYNLKVASSVSATQGDASHSSAISKKVNDTTYQVYASGTGTLFLEFGTGITKADSPSARAELVSQGNIVKHGEYGKKQGANPDGWYDPYRKRQTMGIDAQTPMYSTKKETVEIFKTKAKEKFK